MDNSKNDQSVTLAKSISGNNLKEKYNNIYVFLFLALINWVSHFLYFKRFGLYEDDYANVGIFLGIDLPHLLKVITNRLTVWTEGHPLAFLPVLFLYIGELLGGFQFLYVIALIIVTLNSFLVYKILKKIIPESFVLAIAGALLFSISPSDTTKLYLQHVFILQISLTFFLSATLLYLNNRKALAYLTIILSMFTYESPFMLFFGVPFLTGNWDKKFLKEYLKHFIILCLMIAIVFLYRKLTGETRALEVSGDFFGVFLKIIAGITTGPLYNLFLFIRAPVFTLYHLVPRNTENWWYYNYIYYILSGCFGLFLWLFYKLNSDYKSNSVRNAVSAGEGNFIMEDDSGFKEYFRKIIMLIIAAIILLCLGYTVSFTHHLYIPMGRLTSVHLAATIGGSIIFGCVCASVFFIAERYRLKKYAVIIVSLYLTLLIGYNTLAQKEFVESWSYQKYFWSEVVKLSPDLQDSTVILSNIPNDKLFVTKKFVYPFQTYWNRLMIKYLYRFPENWQMPFYQNISGNPEEDILLKNNDLMLQSEYFPPFALKDSNVILIKMDENDQLVRVDSSVTINGKRLLLKPKEENTVDKYRKTRLYRLLIDPEQKNK